MVPRSYSAAASRSEGTLKIVILLCKCTIRSDLHSSMFIHLIIKQLNFARYFILRAHEMDVTVIKYINILESQNLVLQKMLAIDKS